MTADRYVKFILTVIACELLWMAVQGAAVPVIAQQGPTPTATPTPVIVTGFRIEGRDYTTLPVAIVGGWRAVPGHREVYMMQPVKVQVSEPVRLDPRQAITIQQPLTVQTGARPLSVESVPAQPGARPGPG